MTDIGATNANDLLVFATGMEASGSQANFSGTNASIGEAQVVGDGPRTDPQSGSRSRGLGAPTYTRNYFATNISVDGYNTASVTVNRGPTPSSSASAVRPAWSTRPHHRRPSPQPAQG